MARDTSIVVLRQIEGERLLSYTREQVYKVLYHNGPLTAREVDRAIGDGSHDPAKRLSELRDRGVVKECAPRACRITGRTVLTWDVTSALPHEPRPGLQKLYDRRSRLIKDLKRVDDEIRNHGTTATKQGEMFG